MVLTSSGSIFLEDFLEKRVCMSAYVSDGESGEGREGRREEGGEEREGGRERKCCQASLILHSDLTGCRIAHSQFNFLRTFWYMVHYLINLQKEDKDLEVHIFDVQVPDFGSYPWLSGEAVLVPGQ